MLCIPYRFQIPDSRSLAAGERMGFSVARLGAGALYRNGCGGVVRRAVASAVQIHQAWRLDSSSASMPGSSGVRPSPGARPNTRKPMAPHVAPARVVASRSRPVGAGAGAEGRARAHNTRPPQAHRGARARQLASACHVAEGSGSGGRARWWGCHACHGGPRQTLHAVLTVDGAGAAHGLHGGDAPHRSVLREEASLRGAAPGTRITSRSSMPRRAGCSRRREGAQQLTVRVSAKAKAMKTSDTHVQRWRAAPSAGPHDSSAIAAASAASSFFSAVLLPCGACACTCVCGGGSAGRRDLGGLREAKPRGRRRHAPRTWPQWRCRHPRTPRRRR